MNAGNLGFTDRYSSAIVADVIVMYFRVELYKRPANVRAGQIVPLCWYAYSSVS